MKWILLILLAMTDLVRLVDLARPEHEAAALHPPGPDSGLGLREAAALLGPRRIRSRKKLA